MIRRGVEDVGLPRRLVRSAKWHVGSTVQPHVDRAGSYMFSPPRSCLGRYVNHGDRGRRSVALTFDDGPSSPSSEAMLDVLGEMNVSATFFCVGEQVEWYPEIVSRAFDEGHVVGNHSMCHSRAQAMSVTGTSHLDRADRAIEQVIGRRPRFYRPPWGWLVPWEARRAHARGLTIVGWDVFPDDWKVPENPADVTTDQICSRVQPGSIVLMHDATSGVRHCTKSQSAVAARSVIWRLRSDGYEIVGLPELLGVEPYR